MEKILGARLFERNGRKFELTWLGKLYVEKASQMLELEPQFEAVRRQTERENAGQVRIGIAQRRGIWFLPAVLSVSLSGPSMRLLPTACSVLPSASPS